MKRIVAFLFLFGLPSVHVLAQAPSLLVTSKLDIVNGDLTSPAALIASPGPDGISLREAMLASNAFPGPHVIAFDPSFKGAQLSIASGLPTITGGSITIVGDIDDDSKPDISLRAKSATATACFRISASNVTIRGFIIVSFSWAGIEVITGSNGRGPKVISGILLEENEISGSVEGITISIPDRSCTIRDVAIRQNTIRGNRFGISVQSAWFQSGWSRLSHSNRIISVRISDNVLSDNEIAVFASGAVREGSKGNSISDLTIDHNVISGHTIGSLLITGGNTIGAHGNTVENLTITGNIIDGKGASIEILGAGNGGDPNKAPFPVGMSTDVIGNTVSHVRIVDNTIRGGGIQFCGTDMQGYPAEHNVISDILIDRNTISYCEANAIHVISGGEVTSKHNVIDAMRITNNLIIRNKEAGILLIGGYSTATSNTVSNVDVLNNTIVGNGLGSPLWAGGMNLEVNKEGDGNAITGVRIMNTIFWANAGNDCIRGPNEPESVQNTILGDPRYVKKSNNFYLSPLFVGSENLDFRLEKTSPAIDRGNPGTVDAGSVDTLSHDRIVDGNNDGKAIIDIGAVEYNPSDLPPIRRR